MPTLNRQDTPPRPGPSEEIFRVKAGSDFVGIILSPSLWGVWTHWDGYRTRECTAKFVYTDEGEGAGEVETIREQGARLLNHPTDGTSCRGHTAKWPLRWKGYLFVTSQFHKKVGFLEVTPHGAASLLELAPKDGNLRGLCVRMGRAGKGDKTRISVELVRGVFDVDTLPKNQDPEGTLRALWGWPSKD